MSQQKKRLTSNFTEAYGKLNPQQKEAVDNIEGPVLVNAGPGTGKTQILATRIGKILLEQDVAPHNILCLTIPWVLQSGYPRKLRIFWWLSAT